MCRMDGSTREIVPSAGEGIRSVERRGRRNSDRRGRWSIHCVDEKEAMECVVEGFVHKQCLLSFIRTHCKYGEEEEWE